MRRLFFRAAVSLVLAAGLGGCLSSVPAHLLPLSAEVKNELKKKGLRKGARMFVRIFKEESELEVWLAKADGRFRRFKTYPICNYSGTLGPKLKQGDKQSPEGIYIVRPGQMNPNSKFHLSFNLGYPNKFDAAYRRTGNYLMVHGACASAGCYAMTDKQIQEIYSLAREAFTHGQRDFQVQAFPFRMTEVNLARHKSSKWSGFWRNLKQGNDAFEIAAKPPKVNVCGKRYVFNATFNASAGKINPAEPCPPMRLEPVNGRPVAPEIVEARAEDIVRLKSRVKSVKKPALQTVAQRGADRKRRELVRLGDVPELRGVRAPAEAGTASLPGSKPAEAEAGEPQVSRQAPRQKTATSWARSLLNRW